MKSTLFALGLLASLLSSTLALAGNVENGDSVERRTVACEVMAESMARAALTQAIGAEAANEAKFVINEPMAFLNPPSGVTTYEVETVGCKPTASYIVRMRRRYPIDPCTFLSIELNEGKARN